MSQEAIRDCPSCEQGKHRICTEEVLAPDVPMLRGKDYLTNLIGDNDNWVPCPCAEREHCTIVEFVPVDEEEDGEAW